MKDFFLRTCSLFTVLVVGMTALSAEEALHFDQRTIRQSPSSDDMAVVATFPYSNQTTRTVTITRINPGCGCITATASSMVVPPGGSGVVSVGMELGSLGGTQIKPINLETDHPDEPWLQLSLELNLPPNVLITAAPLNWLQGQVPKAQFFGIVIPANFPFSVEGVTTTDERVKAELKASPDPRRLSVEVNVTDAGQPFSARVEVHMVGSKKRFPCRINVVSTRSGPPLPSEPSR